jgi:hypothetical protein
MSDVRIKAPVIIREAINKNVYRASLPNGKIILAFARPSDKIASLNAGDRYHVLLSLCDFNEGRLVPEDLKGVSVIHAVVDGGDGTRTSADSSTCGRLDVKNTRADLAD